MVIAGDAAMVDALISEVTAEAGRRGRPTISSSAQFGTLNNVGAGADEEVNKGFKAKPPVAECACQGGSPGWRIEEWKSRLMLAFFHLA
jgi:hypothetical protein